MEEKNSFLPPKQQQASPKIKRRESAIRVYRISMNPQENTSGPRSLALPEEELVAKTAFFEAQAESSIDGILVVDPEGRKIFQNQRLVDLFKIPGYIAEDKESLLNRTLPRESSSNPSCFGRSAWRASVPLPAGLLTI